MKRMKKMLLLVAALVILLGCYMLANRKTETATVDEESGTFDLTAQTAQDLTAISWTKDETEFSFTRTDDTWYVTDNDAYPVAQDEVESLGEELIALKGSRKLENVTDLSIYGLSEPTFSVTATFSDGTTTVYNMGDATPFADGYYLSLDSDAATVYTVSDSLSDLFGQTMDDFTQTEDVPTAENVTRITVGSALDASLQEESSTINASQLWYAADGSALDGVDDLITTFGSVEWASVVEAVATDDQLTEWQLDDENAIAVTLYGDESNAEILFGTTDENGDYYARLPESGMVYTVSADTASTLVNASEESLLSLALIETEYADVQEAVFTAGDLNYTYTAAEETEETAEATEEATEETTETAESTDETTEETEETEVEEEQEDPNETLWSQVTAIQATEFSTEAASGNVILTISVTTKSGISATFTFAEYNADSYTVTDGTRVMLVNADAIDKLVRTIKNM